MSDRKDNIAYTERMLIEFKGISKYVQRVVGDVVITERDRNRICSVPERGVSVVSSHRSHLDYLIMGVTLIENRCQQMQYAAGDNLTSLPFLGKKFQKLGAFSVHRGRASQRSYLFKLADFVKNLLLTGHNIGLYPEGGRSYSGRMLESKQGILGAAIMAQKEDPSRDYLFLPVSCSYTIVPDAKYFPLLLKGKKIRDNAKTPFGKILGSAIYLGTDIFTFLKIWLFPDPSCKVYLDVGEAFSVKSVADVDALYNDKSKNEFFANGVAIKMCAEHIRGELLKIYRVMPHNVVAYLISKDIFTPDSAETEIKKILSEIDQRGFNKASLEGLSCEEIFNEGVFYLKKNGVLKGGRSIKVKSRMLLDYFSGAVYDLKEGVE